VQFGNQVQGVSRPRHSAGCGHDSPPGTYSQVREVDGSVPIAQGKRCQQRSELFPVSPESGAMSHAMFPLGKLLKSQVRVIARTNQCAHKLRQARQHRHLLHRRAPVPRISQSLFTKLARRDAHPRWKSGRAAYRPVVLHYRTTPGFGYRRCKRSLWRTVVCSWQGHGEKLPDRVQGHDHPALFSKRITALDCHWISSVAPRLNHPYAAKTRYRKPMRHAILLNSPITAANRFDEAQWAVTPGQSWCFYDGDVCLGGAIIEQGQN